MKRFNKKTLLKIGSMALRICFFFLFVAPLLWLVMSSLKQEQDIFKDMSSMFAFFVKNPTLNNYSAALGRANIFRYILNSLVYVLGIALIGMVVNSLCGYALAKLKVPFSKQIIGLIIILIIIPFESIILPLFLIVNQFGWVNDIKALIIPFIANCFNIYLFRQFFLSVPDEYLEAAKVDGASDLRTFIQIVLPQSKTIFATVFILTFVTHWGDFMWPLIVTSEDSVRTIQIGMQFLFTSPPLQYGLILAGLTISTIPLAVIFLLFQKYYVQSVTSSGIKG